MTKTTYRKIRSFKMFSRAAMTVLLTLLMLQSSVPAQTGSSSIRGTVTDPQGQAVAGANLTLTQIETNSTRKQTTNEKGAYGFDLLPPGTYRLDVEAAGFKKSVISDIRAFVDKPTTTDVQMELGALTESVSVTASGSEVLLNKQDATIGNNFSSQQITQLPIASRNVVELLSLQPGVTRDGYVAGSRADQANVTLDGVDVNEQQSGLNNIALEQGVTEAFASVLRVTPDSVEEFRVTTTNPNAAQGRSSGAQVSLITKSGTNQLHGSLYEFHRNTVTTANDYFNNLNGLPRPKLLRNLFGGSVGGPIKKDRLFFFYNYEGRRDASEQAVDPRVVPLASLGTGTVRYINENGGVSSLNINQLNQIYSTVGINPAAVAVLADAARRYPANDFSIGDGLNTAGFRFNASTPLKWNTHIARLDYNVTSDARHVVFLRGNYQQDTINFAPRFPDTPSPRVWNHPTGIGVGYNWVIGPTLVNNFRYGLTREAFSHQGDATTNAIDFREVFQPLTFDRTLNRTTPTHNFTDDLSWTRGNHTWQFGGNVRLIRNSRTSNASSFDRARLNLFFYEDAGGSVLDPFFNANVPGVDQGFETNLGHALVALIGRYSQYAGNFNFDINGNPLPVGQGVPRTFATQEYEGYVQDVWRWKPSLTITAGLRYGVSRPVYEVNGYQAQPTVSLGDFFEQRKAGAAAGKPFNELITINKSGPANNGPNLYNWDWNNFQPRIGVAWSPSFKGGFLRKFFGGEGDFVVRGGFAIINDYFGQELAVRFDLNNTLGFSSSEEISAETFNITDNPGPRFTGFGQNIRSLPMISTPSTLVFPLTHPADGDTRIEAGLDSSLTTPTHYSWNFSLSRKLPGGLFVEAAYIGRAARNLLVGRDVMAINDLVDPKSGVDWYTAAGVLAQLREASTPINRVGPIAYFENLFPNFVRPAGLTVTQGVYRRIARAAVGGIDSDWTSLQLRLNNQSILGRSVFYHPQYAALSTFSTIGSSDYHAGTLSVRERFHNNLMFDFNYTLSKSMDDASGLQTGSLYGSTFVLNPLRPEDNRAVSDFDVRHIINANVQYQLPLGRGRRFLSNTHGVVDAFLGGWDVNAIYRWNSGRPTSFGPYDVGQWATNWNVQSNGVRIVPIESSTTKTNTDDGTPNLFSDPTAAYRSFRNARAGETGDRNVLRLPSYVSLDMSLNKSFTMPWNEGHKLQFRWEVFNVTNTQRFGTIADLALDIDPQLPNSTPTPGFGTFTGIQGSPRVMQFGLRYTF
ncbi:MAG: carboxypeptidase regulatory-like domain-containing protein [Blastocatellia bacterium]